MERSNVGPDTQLETVIIFTRRMQRLARFYEEALEIGPYDRSPGHMGCQLGAVYFGFDQVDQPGEGRRSGVTLWFTVDDIQARFKQLVRLGAEVRYAPTRKPWGAVLASLYDPDGNILGLSQRQPPD